jgi:glycosyltransferase involved in cell wall biosynthesis
MVPHPRIAFVTYAMHCGGMETLLLRLGQYLRRQGCEVEVLTTVEPGEWFGQWSQLGIRAQQVAGLTTGSLLAPLRHSVRVASKLMEGNFDVVFLHHALHAQASIARLPENVVVIPVLHNDAGPIYQVGCSNPNAWNVAVAVSPKVAATAQQRVPGRPVIQISSGVDLPDATVLAGRPSIGRRVQLIFVGRLEHSQKGVLWLPEILRTCRDRGVDARLTIVGDGPDDGLLQRKLSNLQLREYTRHLRGVTPETVYGLLLETHLLLMPSQYEGLPIALLEGQACGCVPVVSRLPGITDTAVQDGETGRLVDVGDVAGFVEAVAALCGNPQQWARMSKAAHESIRKNFSVEVMGTAYLKLIRDALQGCYPLARPRSSQPALALSLFTWREFLPGRLRRLGRRGRRWLESFSPRENTGHRRA